MGKKLKDITWKSVDLEGFSTSALKENFEGFVGLEECRNYDLDKESKTQKKKKRPKKKKKSAKPNSKETSTNNVSEPPQKKIKLQNGFIVETCTELKPSKANAIDIENNRNETKRDKAKASLKKANNTVKGISIKANGIPIKANGIPIKENGIPIKENGIPIKENGIPIKANGNQIKENGKKIKNNKSKKTPKIKQKLGENVSSKPLLLEDMQAWSQFEIPEPILKALAEQSFAQPTRIQEMTLPSALMGRRDILGAAETGSGKTLAFGIPILSGILKLKQRQALGEDVYEIPYKKTSTKKKVEPEPLKQNTVRRKRKRVQKNQESSEEGYSSDDDKSSDESESDGNESDKNESNQNDSDDNKSQGENSDKEESDVSDGESQERNNDNNEKDYLEEYDVPLRKKEASDADEGNASDDDNYIHLSEIFDSDASDKESETNDDNSEIDDDKSEIDEDESESQVDDDESASQIDSDESGSQIDDDENEQLETVDSENTGIGCVKVIDNIEIPGHPTVKTGKPLYALIITPTRELAIQVSGHIRSAAKYTGIRIATLVGGFAAVKQERELTRSPEIVVATPGRLWELVLQGETHLQQLDSVKFLAIDETDRMVEQNHFEELYPLLERLNADEAKRCSRQNFVFSATLTMVHDLPSHLKGKKVTKRGKILNRKVEKMTPDQKVKKLIDMFGMSEPKIVDITSNNSGTARTLVECRITCSFEEKDSYLYYILMRHPGRTIVFCNSVGCVKRLAQLFNLLKCHPLPLYAGMTQRQRLKNLERFRDDPNGVLVATDVAARGLDIPNVDHVIHYQVPRTAESYVHRSGRTARANKEGLTILIMEPGEALLYSKICRTLNKQTELPQFPVPSHLLSPMKELVTLAEEVERLDLEHRRSAKEQGWLDKAAREMDMIVDEDFVPIKEKDSTLSKRLQIKRKQLDKLLSQPVFPKGYSFKYPTLNDPSALSVQADTNALQVMKEAISSGKLKKNKRLSKNAPLLNLGKKIKK